MKIFDGVFLNSKRTNCPFAIFVFIIKNTMQKQKINSINKRPFDYTIRPK